MPAHKIYIGSDNVVNLVGLKDTEAETYIHNATVKMSLFRQIALHPDISQIAFTGGGTYEIQVGDVIVGATGGATAIVTKITLTSGSWASEDAAGILALISQIGTFEVENLNVGVEADVATIAGDSSGAETANEGAKTKIAVDRHLLTAANHVRIQGSLSYDESYDIDAVEIGKITIPAAYVAEKFTSEENIYVGVLGGVDVTLDYVEASNGNYRGTLPDTMKNIDDDEQLFLFIKADKNTSDLLIRLRCKGVYYLEI